MKPHSPIWVHAISSMARRGAHLIRFAPTQPHLSVYFFNCAPDRSSPKSTYAQEFTVILCTTPFYLQTSVFYLEAFALDFRFSPWA